MGNFIGRSHEEIVTAREQWEAGSERFGTVAGHGGQRIPAPPLPNLRLTPRGAVKLGTTIHPAHEAIDGLVQASPAGAKV